MFTIDKSACCFASYDRLTKRLTSSMVAVDEFSTLISGVDEPNVNGMVHVCSCVTDLITALNLLGVKESDGSDLIDPTI